MLKEEKIFSTYLDGLEYSILNENGNRSAERTNLLHQGIVEFFFDQLSLSHDDWVIKHEERVPCARSTKQEGKKTFSIDITFTHIETNVNVRILFKGIEKSYNKNRENFANTTIGETQRLHGRSPLFGTSLKEQRANDITVFFTILPERVLLGKKAEVTKYTKPHIDDLRDLHRHTHQVCSILECNGGFSTLEEFSTSLTGNVLNNQEVYDNMEEIGENINENIRTVRLRKQSI